MPRGWWPDPLTASRGHFPQTGRSRNGTTIIADEAYLRDSILVPNQDVVAGYDPVMPTFQGQLAEEEVLQLVAYLKSLSSEPQQSP